MRNGNRIALNSNPWHTLGISRSATEDDIKRAYRKKAKTLHPDRNKAPDADEAFLQLTEAYELLLDPERLAELEEPEAKRDPAYNPAETKEELHARHEARRAKMQRDAIERQWRFLRQKRALRKSWLYYPLMVVAYAMYLSIFVVIALIAAIPVLLSMSFRNPLIVLVGFIIWPLCWLLVKRSKYYQREILVYFR